jgi:PAB1-binding protein PBP1
MADDKNTPEPKTPVGTDPEDKGGNDEPKTFTQEELNETLSKRLAKEQEKSEKRTQEMLNKARQEWETEAKLSEEEREQKAREKRESELEEKNRELIIRENKLDAIEKLDELEIPIKFVDLLVSEDKDTMEARIESFAKEWNEAIAQEVKRQLAGDTPKDPKKPAAPSAAPVVAGNTF